MENTEKESGKISYCFGLSVASSLITSGVTSLDIEDFTKALTTVFKGEKPEISPEEANRILQAHFTRLQREKGDKAMAAGKEFLKNNSEKPGVTTLASVLKYKILKEGKGKKPTDRDNVKCHYEGRLISGEVFDSSIRRGQPAEFPVNGVIKGWVEALQLMNTGSRWQLYIPSDLAYGKTGAGSSIGPNETLIFDVELLDIV